MKIKSCIVIDLDGTLIKANSLKIFTKYFFKFLLKKREFKQLGVLLKILLQRKLGKISHSQMKYRLIKLSHSLLDINEYNQIAKEIKHFVNHCLMCLIKQEIQEGNHILISTAAADSYMPYFVNSISLPNIDFIATKFTEDEANYIENKGEIKLKNTMDYIKQNNLIGKSFLSDHIDDLPLFREFEGTKLLVNPSSTTLKVLKKELPNYDFINIKERIYKLEKNKS